jgi:hypothetical protein
VPADGASQRAIDVSGSARGSANANAEASRSKRSVTAGGSASVDASTQADVRR